jgi:hypothetical protein
MHILTTENNRYVFTGYSPIGEPTWARPATDTVFQPVVFTHRPQAESVRLELHEPLRSEVEVVTIITPIMEV